MGAMVLFLIFGTFLLDERSLFGASMVAAVSGLSCFTFFMRREIARPIVFWFLLGLSSLNIDGATFYFYTNSAEAYPEGPHFTPYFYTAAIGIATFGGIFVGFASGNALFSNWSYRGILVLTIILRCLTQLLLVPVFLRWNVALGVPDALWVLTSIAMDTCVFAWRWIPKQVMGSHLTPNGQEATVLALTAGTFNLAMVLSSYVGSFLLNELNIKPAGQPGESLMFAGLWKAQVVSAMIPLLLLALVPILIPDKTQTEKLINVETSSATYNSPYERLRGRGEERHAA
jgi:hypothetical protein